MTPTAAARLCSQGGSQVERQDDEGQLLLRATARGVETGAARPKEETGIPTTTTTMGKKTTTERQATTQHLQLCDDHDD